jgi:hypothetical protein
MDGTRNVRRSNAAAFAALLAIAVAAAAGAQTPAPAPTPPPYPAGVTIDVALSVPVTSETAKVGDTFSFNTTKTVKLGDIDVPAGTPGHGRLAVVVPAAGDQNGALSLQADSIDPPAGPTIWVNVDLAVTPRGHYSKQTKRLYVLPLPIGILPVVTNRSQGNLVLDIGTAFRVITIAPRRAPAPLLTAVPPTPAPTSTP